MSLLMRQAYYYIQNPHLTYGLPLYPKPLFLICNHQVDWPIRTQYSAKPTDAHPIDRDTLSAKLQK